MSKIPVIVSACLLGVKSRYNGADAKNAELLKSLKGFIVIPVCPEQLAGLPTPRPRAEIKKGDGKTVIEKNSSVIDENGADVTTIFIKGANETLKIARITGAKTAFLKEKSPSCGVRAIMRDGKEKAGMGVTTALLKRGGIEIEGVG